MTADHVIKLPLTPLEEGNATGSALVLTEPLSFWGGLEPSSGVIIDGSHPAHGVMVTDTVLFLPSGRGSSSASSVLAEAVRLGTAPAALILAELDEIIALGIFVAHELYESAPPLGLLDRPGFDSIRTGMTVHITGNTLTARPPSISPAEVQ